MPRSFKPQIACSNLLLSGKAVWFTAQGRWSTDIADAVLATDVEQAERLLQSADAQRDVIAGAWLAEAGQDSDGRTYPTHFREKFRVSGPTFDHQTDAKEGSFAR